MANQLHTVAAVILLMTPSVRGHECAAAIEAATGQSIRLSASLQETMALVRDGEYNVIILDQCFLESDPEQAEVLLKHTGSAVVLTINCAITGARRLVQELQGALQSRAQQLQATRQAVVEQLWSSLREPLTTILLECEIALRQPDTSHVMREKLRNIHAAAQAVQERLELQGSVLTRH